jgi:hypothetical protein
MRTPCRLVVSDPVNYHCVNSRAQWPWVSHKMSERVIWESPWWFCPSTGSAWNLSFHFSWNISLPVTSLSICVSLQFLNSFILEEMIAPYLLAQGCSKYLIYRHEEPAWSGCPSVGEGWACIGITSPPSLWGVRMVTRPRLSSLATGTVSRSPEDPLQDL